MTLPRFMAARDFARLTSTRPHAVIARMIGARRNIAVISALTAAASSMLPGAATAAWAQAAAATDDADRAELTRDVGAAYAPGGLVGTLVLLNDVPGAHAFTVLSGSVDKGRAPVIAAAHAAKGRVVAYGHGAFYNAQALQTAGSSHLFANAVRWASAGSGGVGRGSKVIRVGVFEQDETTAPLTAAGFNVVTLDPRMLASQLPTVDVLIARSDRLDAGGIAAVQAWVRDSGGGLIADGLGWGWEQLNPNQLLSTASFNRLLVPLAGIGYSAGTTSPTGPKDGYLADGVGLDSGDASHALAALDQMSAGAKLSPAVVADATRALSDATDVLPNDDTTFLPRLKAVLARSGWGPDGAAAVAPTKAAPIGLDKPAARIAAVLEAQTLARTPVDQIRANPAAASFPGPVPAAAPRLAGEVVLVNTAVPDWHSTGLYAAPGEIVTVTLPASASGKGLGVRIGSHTDELWNVDSWWRFPKITVEQTIPQRSLRIANAFGGTVFITVPDDQAAASLGTIPVTIAGAVAQPYFVKDKTSVADWKATIRNNPAPWAELQGDRIILSVPSYAVRDLDDPEALMTYWDQVADAAADLYAIPHARKRQERYCVDVQISAGYMHSGYPIMTFDDVARTFTNLAILRGTDDKTWGFYHELGHNHQQSDWTWDGMGEVTNNLFSLDGYEVFNGVKPDYSDPVGAKRRKDLRGRTLAYLARGVTPDGETSDAFLALNMFLELRLAFGWQPFTTVFGEYRTLGPDQHPKTELEKHDQFMVRISKVVGKNLGPYFSVWGLTTSDAARQSIASLPGWMPADWPTAGEIAQTAAAQTKTARTK